MRVTTMAIVAALSLVGGVSGAQACGVFGEACTPGVVVWPVYTPLGRHIGVVEAPVQRLPRLEISWFTGQPMTVLYNNPATLPGSVDPYLHLVRLPSVRHSDTVGAYPVGY